MVDIDFSGIGDYFFCPFAIGDFFFGGGDKRTVGVFGYVFIE